MVLKKTGKVAKKPLRKPLKKAAPQPPAKAAKKSLKKAVAAPPKPLKKIAKKAPEPPKPKTGPVPVIPKGWKWKGKKDPKNKNFGLLLVSPDNMPDTFPKPHRQLVPDTYYRVDPKRNEVRCMVTITPHRGLHVAWSTCQVCTNVTTRCICRVGFIHPRSVEHFYIKDRMRTDADDAEGDPNGNADYLRHLINLNHTDITNSEYQQRALYWYVGKQVNAAHDKVLDNVRKRQASAEAARNSRQNPVQGASGPDDPPWDTKPSDRRTANGKKTLKKIGKAPKATEPVSMDLDVINHDAEAMAERMTKQVMKKVAPKSNVVPFKKPLKKVKR